jgi:uncharacterized cupredoxin-like copper-binding protein
MSKKSLNGLTATALILIFLFVLGGCSACNTAVQGSATNEINVDLTTYLITLSQDNAKPRKVTFHVTNSAKEIVHEFVVFKTDLGAGELPTDAAGHVEEDKLQKVDEVEVEPQEEKDLVVQMDPGHYVVVCNQPGHYAQGMYLNFDVK